MIAALRSKVRSQTTAGPRRHFLRRPSAHRSLAGDQMVIIAIKVIRLVLTRLCRNRLTCFEP